MVARAKSFASRYMVTDVPRLVRPLHNAYSYLAAAALYGYARVVRATSTIDIIGEHMIDESATYIYCYWHTFTPLYFCVFPHHTDHAWMQHPAWMVKHVHIMVRMIGVRYLVYGSTGHSGREAADLIVSMLKHGCSTALMPDGPRGPSGILKDGVLHISRESGIPIVPIRFAVSRCIRMRGWDHKHFPCPFSKVRVEFGTPILVTEANMSDARQQVIAALGEVTPSSQDASIQ